MFVLWAHQTAKHPKYDCGKKSCLFCFLCVRTLNKRTTLLKHLDKCAETKPIELTNNSCNKFTCQHCGVSFDSLAKLDDHTWGHK